jgi:hypothetical protein
MQCEVRAWPGDSNGKRQIGGAALGPTCHYIRSRFIAHIAEEHVLPRLPIGVARFHGLSQSQRVEAPPTPRASRLSERHTCKDYRHRHACKLTSRNARPHRYAKRCGRGNAPPTSMQPTPRSFGNVVSESPVSSPHWPPLTIPFPRTANSANSYRQLLPRLLI